MLVLGKIISFTVSSILNEISISKVSFEIPHKISYPYIVFYLEVKI